MSRQEFARCLEMIHTLKGGCFDLGMPLPEPNGLKLLEQEIEELGGALKQRSEHYFRIFQISEKINAGITPKEIFDGIYDLFRELIPYDRLAFVQLVDDGRSVRTCWFRTESENVRIGDGYQAPLEGSSLQPMLLTGRPRIINDLRLYLKEKPHSESTRLIVEEGMRSSLTCPIIARGKPLGFLFFSSMKPETYKNAYVENYMEVAGQLAAAIERGGLYQQLLELNDFKSRFLGIAAHDLRNPIFLIKEYVSLLFAGKEGTFSESQAAVFRKIERFCDQMSELIDSFLDMRTIEAGRLVLQRRPTDLRRHLVEFSESHSMLVRTKEMTLEIEVSDRLPVIEIDPGRIDQVLGNLLSNAVKFSPPGATIRLQGRFFEGGIEISIADEGPGLPPEEAQYLFTDFGTGSALPTHGERSLGLGLSIAKQIVKLHGGRIWVISSPGKGATFSFWLPAAS